MRPLLVLRSALAAIVPVVLLTPSAAHSAWPTNPAVNAPVSALANHATNPQVATHDSCGGIITTWEDVTATERRIYAQRVDAFGQPRWGQDGFPISPPDSTQVFLGIASDDAGGAYVGWSEQRVAATKRDIYLQHVLAAGMIDPAWPSVGLTVCAAAGDQTYPRVVADGSGGAILVWSDERMGVDFIADIFAQRVPSTGVPQWGADGVPVVVAPGYQFLSEVAADGTGGVYVAWYSNGGNGLDVFAQHLEALAGARMWGGAGLPVCTATGDQLYPAVTSQPGRMLLAWTDYRGGSTSDIYAQAIDPSGVILWAPNGVLVSGAVEDQYTARIAPDGAGGAVVAWSDTRFAPFDNAIFAQRVSMLGNRLWSPADGVAVCTAPGRQLRVQITSDENHGGIVGWDDFRKNYPLENDADVYAQRISGTGTPLWTPNGAVISSAPNNQTGADIVPDGAGGAVLDWQDQRVGGTFGTDIYAQEIGATGQVGVRAASIQCAPDPCGQDYVDFGDAPEAIPAYAGGPIGHFPTCLLESAPGTQEYPTFCPPPGSAPGPTGYVKHVQTAADPNAFWLGCSASGPPPSFVDSETNGKMGFSGGPNYCDPNVPLDCVESVTPGFSLGQDECYGDDDAGIAARVIFASCQSRTVSLRVHGCGSDPSPAHLNVLVDWNHDGDWNDNVICEAGLHCAPEWAVVNQPVTIPPGCHILDTPAIFAGPILGASWMRVTLSRDPVPPDFAWNGSVTAPGGALSGGETEDYPVDVASPVGVEPAVASGEFSLAPLVPNPARVGSAVRFTLPASGRASVSAFDLAGRRVRTLVDGILSAGPHTIQWDLRDDQGKDLAAGYYLVGLEAGGRRIVRPLIRAQ